MFEGVAHFKDTPIQLDLTDRVRGRVRVRVRLNNPDYSVSHDERHENQFGYASELFVPKWSFSARLAVFTVGILGLILSNRTQGSLRKGLGLWCS
jgi:hypothetical protein